MKNFVKFAVIIYTIWILIFGFFQLEFGMNINKSTANCPFSAHSEAMCQMNPLEHIEEWQSMFTMIPSQNLISIFFVLFALIILSKLKFWNRFSISGLPLIIPSSRYSFINFQIFNPLKEAFSRGILNPKIF